MNNNELRSRNRRIGLAIFAGMVVLAFATVVFVFSTMSHRREVDAVQPDRRPMKRDLIVVAGITALAVASGFGFYRWRAPK